MKQHTKGTLEQIIANLLRKGETYKNICNILNTSPKRVSRVSQSLKLGQDVPDPIKMGRKPKIDSTIERFVDEQTSINPRSSCNRIKNMLEEEINVSISKTMIASIRYKLGYKYAQPRKRQALTQNQIQKRIDFCEKQLGKYEKWSKQVIISDESRFGLFPDNSKLWLKRGVYAENTFVSKEKYTETIMVWGAIGYNYKSKLIIIEENLKSSTYIEMLSKNQIFEDIKNKVIDNNVHFQQDGAPAHLAKNSIEFIKSKINLIEDWPANSPDLSPIENLWGIMKKIVQKKASEYNRIKESINRRMECVRSKNDKRAYQFNSAAV